MRDTDLYFAGFVGLVLAVMGVGIALDSLRRRKVQAWAEGDLGGNDTCPACGSKNVAELMPQVFVCGACGHEGGDGLPALERERWKRTVAAWSEGERQAKGLAHLEEGRRRVLSADGPLALARQALDAASRLTTRAEDRVALHEQALSANHDAVEELFTAHRLLEDALWLLQGVDSGVNLPDKVNGIAPEFDWRQLAELRDALAGVANRISQGPSPS